jgi:tripartite-type tricarboxylate transporter receptor subunit TctC
MDVRARWLAPRLSAALGQAVIVENRAGAAGNTGTASAAKSAPDGYSLVFIHQGIMSVNPLLNPNVGFVPERDFVPVALLGKGTLALVVTPKLPVKTVAELVSLARQRDGALNYGSPGVGTPPHLAAELFKQQAGVKAVHVPYKGGGQAANDLMGGHVDFSIEGLTVMEPLIRDGRVRVLAVSSPRRVASLPDVPAISEAGVPGYAFHGWTGMVAPMGTPRPIVDKVNRAVAGVLASADGREFLVRTANEIPPDDSPEAFGAFLREDYERMGRLVRSAGIKGE